jgi:hypothetical protein
MVLKKLRVRLITASGWMTGSRLWMMGVDLREPEEWTLEKRSSRNDVLPRCILDVFASGSSSCSIQPSNVLK